MTMFSDGSGTGGTFDSFFDIFMEVSMNNGITFTPFDLKPGTAIIDPLHLVSTGAKWTTIEQGLLVDGLLGDQNANRHPQKSQSDARQFMSQVDGGNGHSGKRGADLHFGLGPVAPGTGAEVTVRWVSSGSGQRTQRFALPALGQHYVVLLPP